MNGVQLIYGIKEIMDQNEYIKILESVMLAYADKNMPII